MSDDGFKRHEGGIHQGSSSTSPYPMSRLAPKHDLVDMAREIQKADSVLTAVVENKLELIADQMRSLQEKARLILEAAERDSRLHRARCQFTKTAGGVYHLYQRPNGEQYFSLLSPSDWDNNPPHAFQGSYRLEADMSFTELSGDFARVIPRKTS